MHRVVLFSIPLFAGLLSISCQMLQRKNSLSGSAKSSTSPEAAMPLPATAAPVPGQSDGTGSTTVPSHNPVVIQGVNEKQPLCGTQLGKSVADASTNKQVRFATFNMLGVFATSLPSLNARIEQIASNIQKVQADVIGIQEAEDMVPWGNSADVLARRLSELTGENWYWCFFRSNPHAAIEPDVSVGGGGPLSAAYSTQDANTKKLAQTTWFMGDAIVSRLPFGSVGARRVSARVLSELPLCTSDRCRSWAAGESRIVMRAEMLLQGRSFHFFNSHFYTNITSESVKSQVRQATQINEYINQVVEKKNAPVAVSCDCNSPEDGAVRAEFLKWGFADAWSTVNPGQPGHTGGQSTTAQQKTASSRIDYLFLKGMTPREAQLFPETASAAPADASILWPSDHLGFVAGPF